MKRQNVIDTMIDKDKSFEEISGFRVRPGNCLLNGATRLTGGVNFTIYSQHATSCELLLFRRKAEVPYAIIRIPERYRTGGIYSIFVYQLNVEEFEYCYRFNGPYDPSKGLLYDRKKPILDPYAKAVLADKPSALCYADNNQSYSCNEITIYWNSPLIYLMAMEK